MASYLTEHDNKELIQVWELIKAELKAVISPDEFEIWLKNTSLLALDEKHMVIAVNTPYVKHRLENNYFSYIEDALMKITGLHPTISFQQGISTNIPEPALSPLPEFFSGIQNRSFGEGPIDISTLNSKYTFDTFVIGEKNRFAYAASQAVANMPAKAYNPLFIYGGVGLGKTHLMHAIGNYTKEASPSLKVLYVSSEKFTHELINSIQNRTTDEFRAKYRSIDVLLIDDIQFLEKKEQTQEEFFHTFNELRENDKQIVISSDRPPKEIETLSDRLRSRFEWGLITDIQPPDFETRVAILRKKAELDNISLDDSVLNIIADRIHSNIRELEGALIRISAYASLEKRTINQELVEEALKHILVDNKQAKITYRTIQEVVAKYYKIRLEDFTSQRRTKIIAFPRQIAMYLTRELTDLSLPKIGKYFGGRDHTTVMHAHEKITNDMRADNELKGYVEEMIMLVKNYE
ncbi:MAG: chromosomal replication initiator protein DnaA [Clostridia bacterium]